MAALTSLLGTKLQSKDGSVETASLSKKVIALYFSASWCGPCQSFTPQLIKWYEGLREKDLSVEIVFVSSDRDAASMEAYYKKMPWLAMPFDARALKDKLSAKLKVRGIPTLAFMDGETGEVYSTDGRSVVMSDPEGADFPWQPPSLRECLGSSFVRGDGSEVALSELEGKKHIALYFSAHWCPPCKAFTPKLVALYKKLVTEGDKDWEVIFVSSDHSQDEFDEYFGEMPWLAVPLSDKKRKERLSTHFGVEGIPSLVMLNPDLELTNGGLRGYVDADPEGAEFPWTPKPVLTLEQGAGEINELPALLVLMEEEKGATRAQFEGVLARIAEAHLAKVKAKTAEPALFLMGVEEDGVAQRVRELCKLPLNVEGGEKRTLCNGDMCMQLARSTAVVLLDIPDRGGFYVLDGELTADNMARFFDAFVAGDLKPDRKQLGA